MTAPELPFIDLKSQYGALKDRIQQRMMAVLEHGQYIMGPEVKELELALAQFTGAEHCITVSSGTEALLIALMALDLQPGDEVITTPFTFASTAEVICLLGAKPVFVDIEPETCNVNVGLIEEKITPLTRALMPVSLYGQVADMTQINQIAERFNLPVIEDAAQSFGATYQGRKSGALSTLGCTSFFPSKPLGCYGDGGAIFTNDADLAVACREIRVHGQSQRYTHTRLGVGGRMDTLQCAVVLAKLERFEWEIERRRQAGEWYHQALADMPEVSRLTVRPDRTCVWGQYTIFVKERQAVQAELQARGIPTAVHYPTPLHLQPAYAKFAPLESLVHSERVSQQVLSLPMSADITPQQQYQVIKALKEALLIIKKNGAR
jgi:UDP-2-acetamido-2-deoxy-ribo-hexuluronate aminotransferase